MTGLVAGVSLCAVQPVRAAAPVERWGVFELALKGPADGNPYDDVRFSCQFYQERGTTEVQGFYDGRGTYRVRFMPPKPGKWYYTTVSNAVDLEGRTGEFTVTKPQANNHGPVSVAHIFHFAYADGTPFKPIGTTCYGWAQLGRDLDAATLKRLAGSPFNKVRFPLFPKSNIVSRTEPRDYPFEGTRGQFNARRFNPNYFHRLERRIADLQKRGIEADLILFRPYDQGQGGFDTMTAADDDRYLHYVVARLSAFRNVWWTVADGSHSMTNKTDADFDRFGTIVTTDDRYHHLLSIHNGQRIFNQTRPWITHASVQSNSTEDSAGGGVLYRDAYRKPIVFDDVGSDDDIPTHRSGLSDEEMVFRFWEVTVSGTYGGANETDLGSEDPLRSSKAGASTGKLLSRLSFLRHVLDEGPAEGIDPIDKRQDSQLGGRVGRSYLVYLGKAAPTSWTFRLPSAPQDEAPFAIGDGMKLTADVLDTWNMTITPVENAFTLKRSDAHAIGDHGFVDHAFVDHEFVDKDQRSISLPGRPYIAIRIRRLPQ